MNFTNTLQNQPDCEEELWNSFSPLYEHLNFLHNKKFYISQESQSLTQSLV